MVVEKDSQSPKFNALNAYRALLGIGLLAGFHFFQSTTQLGTELPQLYLPTALLFSLWSCVLYWTSQSNEHVISYTIGDGLFILLLSTASGGLESGLPYLALPLILAATEIRQLPHIRKLVASVTGLFILTELFIASTTGHEISWVHMLAFPAIALLLTKFRRIDNEYQQKLAQQKRPAQVNASQERALLEQLETGVIALSSSRQVRYMNHAAWYMLGLPARTTEMSLGSLSNELQLRLLQWQKHPENVVKPFQSGIIEISPRFMRINNSKDIMILLENQDRFDRESRNIKHTALGRLTMSIAHEIRNPLGAIGHASQLLGESANLDPADHRLNRIIIEQSQRMNAIIENIMQLGRQNTARSDTFMLKTWLENFKSEFTRTHDMQGFNISVDVTPANTRALFDQTHLFQILTNLCQNSIRHSESNRKLIIIRGGQSRDNDGLFLDIIDDGKGISPEQAQHIYEPFYTSETGGTGLGLYISRELAEANHGKLEYVPVPTGGSCFRIRLPNAKPQQKYTTKTEMSAN